MNAMDINTAAIDDAVLALHLAPATLCFTGISSIARPIICRMTSAINPIQSMEDPADAVFVHEDRLWRDNGWTRRVIKNEEDDGWAVEMTQDGEADPALVGPWTMGRDKKARSR
jgi:hypothetical protein